MTVGENLQLCVTIYGAKARERMPFVLDLIEDALLRLKREMGISILLVEQYLDFVAAVSDYVYIMDRGTIIAEGNAGILADPNITRHLSV